MNDRNLNPAYHEALANARGISTAAPRAVGEFQGFIDGAPAVRWIDRKNMPNVGDKLFLDPARAAGIEPRMWSILLTSANHGVVGPLAHPFKHAGEHHERVVVVEVPAAAGAPVDQVDLKLVSGAGAAAADAHPAPGHFAVVKLDEAIAWATQLPIPTRGASTMVSKLREAREALLVAPVAVQAGQVAPADLQVRRATDELSLPELAEQFAAVEALGCDYTLSAKVCGKLFRAMTTPPDDAAGQVAVPEGFALVHEDATNEMIAAIEREVESQLDASGIARSDMCRLDGEHIFDALFDALPAVAQQAPAATIDTPWFRDLLANLLDAAEKAEAANDPELYKPARQAFIEHIDAQLAAQASTAGERQEGGDRG